MVLKATSSDQINRAVTDGGTRICPGLSLGTLTHLEVKESEENSAKKAERKQPDMLEANIQANVGVLEAK